MPNPMNILSSVILKGIEASQRDDVYKQLENWSHAACRLTPGTGRNGPAGLYGYRCDSLHRCDVFIFLLYVLLSGLL